MLAVHMEQVSLYSKYACVSSVYADYVMSASSVPQAYREHLPVNSPCSAPAVYRRYNLNTWNVLHTRCIKQVVECFLLYAGELPDTTPSHLSCVSAMVFIPIPIPTNSSRSRDLPGAYIQSSGLCPSLPRRLPPQRPSQSPSWTRAALMDTI